MYYFRNPEIFSAGRVFTFALLFIIFFNIDSRAQETPLPKFVNDTVDYTPTYNAGEKPQYIITVSSKGEKLGDVIIELYPDIAPKHCKNFDSLVYVKFYDGTAFHRVVPDFVVQGGGIYSKEYSRELWGRSDDSQAKIPAEFSDIDHEEGVISAARRNDINSATSQFFICLDDVPSLDGNYTIFGKVLEGMDIIEELTDFEADDKNFLLEKVEMTIKRKE